MPRRLRRRIVRPVVSAVEACEPRQLFSTVAPAFADKIGLAGVVDYSTTFEDNFDGTSIDKTKWQVRDGARWRAYRDAPISTFSYTDESPIQVANGELSLIAHNDPVTGQLKGAYLQTGRTFTSSTTTSPVANATLTPGYTGDFVQTYGYWESRAKFSSLPGEWGAFWVHSPRMGDVGYDASKADRPDIFGTEMDVAENAAIRQTTIPAAGDVNQLIHASGYNTYHKLTGFYNATVNFKPSKTPPDQYHVYGLLWTKTSVSFYIDGIMTGSTTDPKMISGAPQMAMLSVEVGAGGSKNSGQGSNSAGYTPAGGYGSKATSKARATFDYVRVWRLASVPAPTGNASAKGTVYVDDNLDGIRETGEAARSGVTVFADYDADGTRDWNEPYGVTDANGNYSVANIAPSKAIDLRVVLPSGASIVSPTDGEISYMTRPGRLEEMQNYAITFAVPPTTTTPAPTPTPAPAPTPAPTPTQATAGGVVFVDTDGDGARDANEAVKSGVVVWADLDGDGVRDANEQSATTTSTGAYSIAGLTANVAVQIRMAIVSGYTVGTPSAGYYAYKPTAGQSNAAFHFGLKLTPVATPPVTTPPVTTPPVTTPVKPTPPVAGSPTIRSAVYIDANGNGVRDAGEVGKAGVLVFLDMNYNGIRDGSEAYTTTAADGTYAFTGLPINVSVRVMIAGVAGYLPTTPTGGYSFRPYAGMINTRVNFGLRKA